MDARVARIAPRDGAKMAELDFERLESGYAGGGRAARWGQMANLAGAACSVALVIGLGLWGYKLAVRDVQGVPVMRALAGPMREAPKVPGGDIASHQGLSVNAVAAVGTAAALPDQVVLAPRPVDLSVEDVAGMAATLQPLQQDEQVTLAALDPGRLATPPDAGATDSRATDASAADAGATDGNAPGNSATDAAVARALADVLAEGVAPLSPLDPVVEPTSQSAPAASLRPRARPGSALEPKAVQPVAATAPAEIDPAQIAPAEIDPGQLAVGTRLVQLGAFDTDAEARAEWARLVTKFGDLISGKSLVIEAAQSGGSTFYRLRAHGFDAEADARRFCAALVAEDTPCIPAAQK